jgi:ubiquitin C-terminal hydrolase
LSILEGIVATFAALPLETCYLSYLFQCLIGCKPKFSQAQTSTRQVPTKSGNGSWGSAVFKYTEIASRIFDSRVGRSDA